VCCYLRVRMVNVQTFRWYVSYLKAFVLRFDKKDVSDMLQRGTARTLMGHWVRCSNDTDVTDFCSRSGFCCVCRNEGGNWNWEYRTCTGANWHFTWLLTTNCPPVGTSESGTCLTGSVCEVYISLSHTMPCDSALCSIVLLHLCQRWIIRAL
jgi:hypothetical protein